MKTVLQSAINKLQEEIEFRKDGSLTSLGLAIAVDVLTELLPNEKEQLRMAFDAGEKHGDYLDELTFVPHPNFNSWFTRKFTPTRVADSSTDAP